MNSELSSEISPDLPSGGVDLIQDKGYCIGSRGQALLRLETDRHFITMAATGSGKGRSVVIPNLLIHQGSVFTTEIGGENLRTTIKYRKEILGQEIYIIDPLETTQYERDCINILDTLDINSPTFISDIELICQSILQDNKGGKSQDPYWTNAPKDLLFSLILYVKTAPSYEVEDSERHFPYIANLLSSFESDRWDNLMSEFATDEGEFKERLNDTGSSFLNLYNDNTRSVVSVLRSFLGFARDPQISKYIKHSTFDLKDLRHKKCTVYVVMPLIEYYKANSTWLRLLIERAMNACPDLQNQKINLSHDERILFMLDEFTQLGNLDAIDTGMQTARHKGITMWCVFQDFNRLKEVYGNNLAHSFLGSAGCIQAFGINDLPTAELISKRAGKRIAYIPSVTEAINWNNGLTDNWSETISSGLNVNLTKGKNEGESENWSESFTKGYSHGISDSNTVSSFSSVGSGHNWSSGGSGYSSGGSRNSNSGQSESKTIGKTESWQDSRTQQRGKGKNITNSESVSTGRSDQESFQQGKSVTTNQGGQYSINYTPQILPSLETDQVMQALSDSSNTQILIIRERVILDKRANFDQVKILSERINGPSKFLDYPRIDLQVNIINHKSILDDIKHPSITEKFIFKEINRPKELPILGEIISEEKLFIDSNLNSNYSQLNFIQINQEKNEIIDSIHNLEQSTEGISLKRILKKNKYGSFVAYKEKLEQLEIQLLKNSMSKFIDRVENWQKYYDNAKLMYDRVVNLRGKYKCILNNLHLNIDKLTRKRIDLNISLNNIYREFNKLEQYSQKLEEYNQYVKQYYLYIKIWPDIDKPLIPKESEFKTRDCTDNLISLKNKINEIVPLEDESLDIPELENCLEFPCNDIDMNHIIEVIDIFELLDDYCLIKDDFEHVNSELKTRQKELKWKIWRTSDRLSNQNSISKIRQTFINCEGYYQHIIDRLSSVILDFHSQSTCWISQKEKISLYLQYLDEYQAYLYSLDQNIIEVNLRINDISKTYDNRLIKLELINNSLHLQLTKLLSDMAKWKVWKNFKKYDDCF